MFVAHTVVTFGETVADGRSAILFATVAGVSLGLVTGGAAPPPRGARADLRVAALIRGSALVLLGLALTTLLQPPIAVILDYYGFAFLLLIGPLFLRRRGLVLLALGVAVGGPLVVALLESVVAFDDLAEPLQIPARWLVFGNYPVVVWLAYLLVGLVLARSDLRRRRTALLALGGGAVAALLGYGLAALVPGIDASAHADTTAEVVASGGVAVAIIGALSLLDSATGSAVVLADVARLVLSPVAAAGSMALTLYVAHAVVLTIVRDAVAADGWMMPPWVLPALIVGSLVIAPLWRRLVGPGPLEAGLRALTRLASPRRPRVAP